MQKPFNASLSDDITRLKTIHNNAGSCADYRNLFSNIMAKHKISRSTVYAELAKSLPGYYKKQPTRANRAQIGANEIDLVRKLFHERKKNKEIRKLLERELGFPCSERRLKRIKTMISHINAKKMTQEEAVECDITPKEMRIFFHVMTGLDTMDPNRKHTINLGGRNVKVSSLVIKNAIDSMAESAAHDGKHLHEISRNEMETVLMRQIQSVKAGTYISPAGLKALEATRRSLERSDSTAAINASGYEALFCTVRHFAPLTTRSEITRVLDKYLDQETIDPDTPENNSIGTKSDLDSNQAA